ncbi:MAG TPA: lipoyl(octanoyl) transferase LipB [Bacteroidales bacterium]|nr:lipoyl(octanoyl) transferase LipB [Bacteroidales bacterium]HOS72041.1 lipoyl(octanoyl) transferase LipB [Bacteroidales bacterium]HQH24314.1 lipoyl(octanoyl) transferase LipB [Bacteroidales bacterium]HQJ81549.1 lipoyl(octanoyl) transferase LipB [Bacteroidales bacterium]
MKYNVKFEDIGLKDYKETWDYQAGIFEELKECKTGGKMTEGSGEYRRPGTLILVEHPSVYTLGKSGSGNNLFLDSVQLRAKGAQFYRIDRGGDITYHGPGQIVGYPIFDLEILKIGLKEYVFRLEEALIRTIGEFGLTGSRLQGGTGVWLDPGIKGRARKICAIGVKASRYITMHGFAFNVNTDLRWFDYINPCGFTDKGVTSLERETGLRQDMGEVKTILKDRLRDQFGLEWINEEE